MGGYVVGRYWLHGFGFLNKRVGLNKNFWYVTSFTHLKLSAQNHALSNKLRKRLRDAAAITVNKQKFELEMQSLWSGYEL